MNYFNKFVEAAAPQTTRDHSVTVWQFESAGRRHVQLMWRQRVCGRWGHVCVSAGSRRKERLVSGDSEEDQDSEESRRTMDLSLLREQYRSSREAQRRHTQVLLLRTGERKHAAGSCRPEVVKLLSCKMFFFIFLQLLYFLLFCLYPIFWDVRNATLSSESNNFCNCIWICLFVLFFALCNKKQKQNLCLFRRLIPLTWQPQKPCVCLVVVS